MMPAWQIVVEGPSDGHVLHQVVKHMLGNHYCESSFQQYGKPNNREYHYCYTFENGSRLYITSIGGYTNLPGILTKLQYVKDGLEHVPINTNLVMFDADSPENNGGFECRKSYFEREFIKVFSCEGVKTISSYDLFLFPNNKDDGMLETLLLQSLSLRAACISPCILKFKSCISENQQAVEVMVKEKHQAALFAWFAGQRANHSLRFEDSLKDDSTWDFEGDAFAPLREFLVRHITPLRHN